MPGCADFEIAIDMRAHGALGDAEREALERHLSSCDRCRGYEAEARETERLMQGAASEALGQVDWEVIRGQMRRARWRLGLAGIVLLCAAAYLVGAALHLPADPAAVQRFAFAAFGLGLLARPILGQL